MCVICNSNICVCVCVSDIPMSVGIVEPKTHPSQLNAAEFLWDLNKRTSVFVQVTLRHPLTLIQTTERHTHIHTSLFEPPAQRAAEFPHQTRFDFIVSTRRLQVHCISTEFTPRKHGGEKGVPFRIQIDTFALGDGGDYTEHLHSASCQIKVFKVLTQS